MSVSSDEDVLARAKTQYERRRLRQQKLAEMDHYAKGVEDLLNDTIASTAASSFSSIFDDGASYSSSSVGSRSSRSSFGSIPSGRHSPPEGAVETARKFLWDEDDDDISLPPSRGFDGRVYNVPGGSDEENQSNDQHEAAAGDEDKSASTARSSLFGLFRQMRYSRVSTSASESNIAPRCSHDASTEFGADAASTISSHEESENQGMVRIELGEPADIGNRPRAPRRRSRCCAVICGKCRSICDATVIMMEYFCVTLCCMPRTRKRLLCLVLMVVIALGTLGAMGLRNRYQQQGGIEPATNTSSLPPELNVSTAVPVPGDESTLIPGIDQELYNEPTQAPTTEDESTLVPTQTDEPTVPEVVNPTNVTNEVPLPNTNMTNGTETGGHQNSTDSEVNTGNSTTTDNSTETNSSGTEEHVPPLPSNPNGLPPYDIGRHQELRTAIVRSKVTALDDLDTLGTPQNKAILWLTDFDKAKIPPGHKAMLHRYALATLFFSTTSIVPPSSAGSLAQQVNAVLTDPKPNWKSGDKWMTSLGICAWEGVSCVVRGGENRYDDNDYIVHLNMASNNVRGTLPSEIAALHDLWSLDMSENSLEGTLPAAMGNMSALAHLNLGGNEIAGSIPSELGLCKNLRDLNLGRNNLQGSIPTQLLRLPNVGTLKLGENALAGTLPDVIHLSKLEILDLGSNSFTGSLPTTYGHMTNLVDLLLGRNELQGGIPTELAHLSNLVDLDLEDNGLTGTVPNIFEFLPKLEKLYLQTNKFTGSLPLLFGNLDELEVVHMESNGFEGTIPPAYGTLPKIKSLHLFNNKLTGTLPDKITGWQQSLTDLQANHNGLSGTLPIGLGFASNLEVLHLQDNQFGGTIPDSFGQLEHLRSFKVYHNFFRGSVPPGVCNLVENHHLENAAADCAAQGGTIQCSCCQECHPQ